ncbi:BrxA/BrxB family bacilliredoxin [Halalkalibacterium halodurans]|nr:BrxA/BrxB family bacilliredoxin [Halalkalibacterium halodurans]MDY7223310.1 BrxA/BrxB family bacilliredoxin [Halalkalibacterium halodurans]MDY7242531.1 BrxA/BrxB family bacilliredoxin [Halalkalibacterium halodurans]MED3647953.1 BrxA/BrxB family bacilliredoxin [Halalkalibacterium halodurans]MED4080254.1 BrxA/BrxB family bacilliredoxin [Halalkalibacterium halodurans]MED4084678.1 BrxA/BrxB family bacilliredoxin [Halalkalibacterium halodurans]
MEFNFFMNDVVQMARKEMVESGYDQLTTPEEVDEVLKEKGTVLVMVNSVCGCAGGIARPAAAYMKNYDKKPDRFVTVFAGQDKEATARAREYFKGYAPSSPSFALLKDGEIQMMVERHEIEGHEPIQVVQKLEKAFDQYCS